MIVEQMLMAATSEGGYNPNAVKFDGTNDSLTKASLTGISDSKSGIISAWIRVDGAGSGTTNCVIQGYNFELTYTVNGVFAISGYNAAVAVILDIRTSLTKAALSAKWVHILASWDLAAGVSNIYVNDVSDQSVVTRTNDTIDYSNATYPSWGIGCNYSGASLKMNGALADLYFAPGQYLDFSVEANRRKFIDAGGLPVSLGSDGSLPTSTAPAIYLKGNSSAFGTNSGTGGNFTVNGALEKASSTPATTAVNAVDFDGTNDYLSRASDLTGVVDGAEGTFSCWLRKDGADGSAYSLVSNTNSYVDVRISSANKILVVLYDTTVVIAFVSSTSTVLASPVWRHLLISWKLSGTPTLKIYLDGADVTDTPTTLTTGSVDYTRGSFNVGIWGNVSSYKFNGAIAELYFAPNQYLDLSVQANREKFIKDGKPVSLGATGSLPTGTAPAIYLPNRAALVGTNAGTGGNFTINGAPKDANSTPLYYYAEPVKFDGTNDYLSKAGLTGVSNGTNGTLSFWIRVDETFSGQQDFFMTTNGSLWVHFQGTALRVRGYSDSGGTVNVLSMDIPYTFSSSPVWRHVLLSWSSSACHCYVDNAASLTGTPTVSGSIYYTAATWYVGGTGTYNPACAIADLWFNTTYIDISQASNRAKFIDQTTLRPVPLGAKGELPTGSQPLLYLGRDFSNFQTNLGSGGNFTVTGALERATTSPSDVSA